MQQFQNASVVPTKDADRTHLTYSLQIVYARCQEGDAVKNTGKIHNSIAASNYSEKPEIEKARKKD